MTFASILMRRVAGAASRISSGVGLAIGLVVAAAASLFLGAGAGPGQLSVDLDLGFKDILPIGIEATGFCSDLNARLLGRRVRGLVVKQTTLGVLPDRNAVYDDTLIGCGHVLLHLKRGCARQFY
jgi:hypothetical protein